LHPDHIATETAIPRHLFIRNTDRPTSQSYFQFLWLARICVAVILSSLTGTTRAQMAGSAVKTPATPASESPGTSTDLFLMFGSDVDRPGLLPRANYNIGIGHTFAFLKKDPVGDELSFAYTYENSGSHGFLHTNNGEHTETAGIMKNFGIGSLQTVSGYTWIQGGITSYTGNLRVQNRLASGLSLGAIIHCSRRSSIWVQESYNKVVTVPWYTTASIGYTFSW
jgi:hypothetical protein